jgi:preprotein translocase subunit SecF
VRTQRVGARYGGIVATVTARNIVGASALLVLLGIAVYLLFQIPWQYGVGGIVALVGILAIIGSDAPDAL